MGGSTVRQSDISVDDMTKFNDMTKLVDVIPLVKVMSAPPSQTRTSGPDRYSVMDPLWQVRKHGRGRKKRVVYREALSVLGFGSPPEVEVSNVIGSACQSCQVSRVAMATKCSWYCCTNSCIAGRALKAA
jgi:hypothetical protein